MDTKLNFAALLQGISEQQPSGPNLRADTSATSLFYAIKDSRAKARSLERSAIASPDNLPKAALEWQKVQDLAIIALQEKTKDIEITCWLVEALLHTSGFAGLAQGFKLLTSLIEHFWDSLYPLPDDDDSTTKIAAITNLNGEDEPGVLISAIAMVPIIPGKNLGPYAFWHYQQALETAKIKDEEKLEERIKSGALSLQMLETAAAETSAAYFAQLITDLQDCLTTFAELHEALANADQDASSPSSKIVNALTDCLDCVHFLARNKLSETSAIQSAIVQQTTTFAAPSTIEQPLLTFTIQSREQAFKALESIADYFRHAEPHSPLPYLLERTARWGRMALPELLNEIISDEHARRELFYLTGIPITNNED
jgi:type VI secretion system protein ImpA